MFWLYTLVDTRSLFPVTSSYHLHYFGELIFLPNSQSDWGSHKLQFMLD